MNLLFNITVLALFLQSHNSYSVFKFKHTTNKKNIFHENNFPELPEDFKEEKKGIKFLMAIS